MTARPTDIVDPLVWTYEESADGRQTSMQAYVNPDAHYERCRVYWGSHGCCRPGGHDGDHWCSCCDCDDHPDHDSGCVAGPPYYGPETKFYGDDVPDWEPGPGFEVTII